jgi:superoxide dismutase, Fe-Mn family
LIASPPRLRNGTAATPLFNLPTHITEAGMFTLPPLPFAEAALEPHISARTMKLHHGAHHKTYVETLNKLVADTPFEELTLEEIIQGTVGASDAERRKIFNNAGQHWNHSFFWESLSPSGGGALPSELAQAVVRDFGTEADFRAQLIEQGKSHFGSGWLWVVLSGGKLQVTTTHDADTPITHGQTPLLTCDLWEHAYYLDHQNRRPEFLSAWLENLANWDFAEANLVQARSSTQA